MRPRIFFSYSLTKTTNSALVQKAITFIKEMVQKRGWEIVDPMEPNIVGIREKVESGLWEADGAIIEATTSSPNVMFEAGFARAFSYPCLFLVDTTAFESAGSKEYFRFLNLDAKDPLPADLGDVEYLRYPAAIVSQNEWATFGEAADHYLNLFAKLLSPEAVLARRSTKDIQRNTIEILERHSHRHPIIGFQGAVLQCSQTALRSRDQTFFRPMPATIRTALLHSTHQIGARNSKSGPWPTARQKSKSSGLQKLIRSRHSSASGYFSWIGKLSLTRRNWKN